MSYSYNQRRKNLNNFKKSSNQRFYFEIDGKKKTFRSVDGSWKIVDYIEPVSKEN